MESKTPQFDTALDEILNGLEPHTRACPNKEKSSHCMGDFKIYQEDIDMYKKLRVPPGTYCPHCRNQRRAAWMPNLLQFYKKEDVVTGEKIVSSQHPSSPYKTVHNKYYFDANAWDELEYGRDYDSNKPFFEQFHKLYKDVPHFSLPRFNKNIINSEYTVDSGEVKNCYFCATMGWCEDCMYSVWIVNSQECVDCLGVDNSENCYENVINNRCSNSSYLQQCFDCLNCVLCYDCKNCTDCFGCTNLRNKQYCFFNEQLTKEEYEKKMAGINMGDRDGVAKYKKKLQELKMKSLHKYAHMRQSPNCVGHQIGGSKNCYYVFWGIGENIRWSSDIYKAKDSMDVTITGPGELCYNGMDLWDCFDTKNSYFVGQSYDLDYCFECFDCKNCFASVGLKKKQYCIFNKQYSEEEYWKKVDEIKINALWAGEYGEFLDLNIVPYQYKDSFSQALYPMNEEEMIAFEGVQYEDVEQAGFSDILDSEDVPKDIKDVNDDILEKAIRCEVSGKLFRIVDAELEFYRKNNIPIPTRHPQVRIMDRLSKRNPLKLRTRSCMCAGKKSEKDIYENTIDHFHGVDHCLNEFETSYAPDRPEIIYCKECYEQEIV